MQSSVLQVIVLKDRTDSFLLQMEVFEDFWKWIPCFHVESQRHITVESPPSQVLKEVL